MQYVYILQCADGLYYTGCTHDLKARILSHSDGQVFATKSRLPVTLIFYCAFRNEEKAFGFEKYLKSGSGRALVQKRFL
jgi:predicted GIY-YIG superfamily endonuclease